AGFSSRCCIRAVPRGLAWSSGPGAVVTVVDAYCSVTGPGVETPLVAIIAMIGCPVFICPCPDAVNARGPKPVLLRDVNRCREHPVDEVRPILRNVLLIQEDVRHRRVRQAISSGLASLRKPSLKGAADASVLCQHLTDRIRAR